jgi:hypothetical protein
MTKPVLEIEVTTADGISGNVKAVFDTGSFYTLIREDKVPPGARVIPRKEPRVFRTAARGQRFSAVAELPLVLTIGDKAVEDVALVATDLSQEMLVGAGTLQKWDISIITRQGRTEVSVGRHMRDPDIMEVDGCTGFPAEPSRSPSRWLGARSMPHE